MQKTPGHGRRKGGQEGLGPLDFEIISKKRLFFQFRGVKAIFTTFDPPVEKILGKSPTGPPLGKSIRRPCSLCACVWRTM